MVRFAEQQLAREPGLCGMLVWMAIPPVIIVGAGPTGATLALCLTQGGIPVCLIEAAPGDPRLFRGQALMPCGMEVLAYLGITGIPTQPLSAWEFWLEGRLLFRADEPMGSPYPCTLIAQAPFLAQVLERAERTGLVQQRLGIPVTDLLWHGDQVVGVRLATGEEISGSLVVGADGRHSQIRQLGGLPVHFSGTVLEVSWHTLPVASAWQEDNVFCTCIAQNQILVVFLGADPEYLNLAWVGRGSLDLEIWIPKVPPALAAHFHQHGHALSPPFTVRAQAGYCPQWWRPGLLLLGDAAHPMSPVRAQGLTMGLRDVLVAAAHLLKHWGSPTLDLSSIEQERRPEIRRIQRLQALEAWQGELLRTQPGIRTSLSQLSLLVGSPLRRIWLHRQHTLRHGIAAMPTLPDPRISW